MTIEQEQFALANLLFRLDNGEHTIPYEEWARQIWDNGYRKILTLMICPNAQNCTEEGECVEKHPHLKDKWCDTNCDWYAGKCIPVTEISNHETA